MTFNPIHKRSHRGPWRTSVLLGISLLLPLGSGCSGEAPPAAKQQSLTRKQTKRFPKYESTLISALAKVARDASPNELTAEETTLLATSQPQLEALFNTKNLDRAQSRALLAPAKQAWTELHLGGTDIEHYGGGKQIIDWAWKYKGWIAAGGMFVGGWLRSTFFGSEPLPIDCNCVCWFQKDTLATSQSGGYLAGPYASTSDALAACSASCPASYTAPDGTVFNKTNGECTSKQDGMCGSPFEGDSLPADCCGSYTKEDFYQLEETVVEETLDCPIYADDVDDCQNDSDFSVVSTTSWDEPVGETEIDSTGTCSN